MDSSLISISNHVTLKLQSCGKRQRVFCDAADPFLTRMVAVFKDRCLDVAWHTDHYWCLLREDWDDFYHLFLETADQCGVNVNLELIE
ncbi:MAG: hypothetical protein U9N57_01335 [Pseudomonadota bacterium]|nr:hypothetical protein [Pseudomonadota bacterium]